MTNEELSSFKQLFSECSNMNDLGDSLCNKDFDYLRNTLTFLDSDETDDFMKVIVDSGVLVITDE